MVWHQIASQDNLPEKWMTIKETFISGDWWRVILAFLLVFVNWGSEGYKWKRLMKKEYPVSLVTSVKAAFAGNATGIFTPNRIGGFVGRVMYLPKEMVLVGTMNTFVGNLAQLLATIFFGVIGAFALIYIPIETKPIQNVQIDPWYPAVGFSIGLLFLALIYFFPDKWIGILSRVSFLNKYMEKVQFLANHSRVMLFEVFVWSLFRYVVFAFQFYLLLTFFGATFNFFTCLMLVGYLYLVISLLPTVFGKLGVREVASIGIFGWFLAEIPTTTASFLLWMINVAFASVLGGIFVVLIRRRK